MIDVPSNSCKLVEYNTIASSFGCLSQKVKEVQAYIRQKYSDQIKFNYEHLDSSSYSESDAASIDFAKNKMDSFLENMVGYFERAIIEYKRTVKDKFGYES